MSDNEKPFIPDEQFSEIQEALKFADPVVPAPSSHLEPRVKDTPKDLTDSTAKEDINELRVDILCDMKDIDDILKSIKQSIQTSDVVTDRYLARKAEIFTFLMDSKSSLRKELLRTYKDKRELLDRPAGEGVGGVGVDGEDGKKTVGITVSGLKALLKQRDKIVKSEEKEKPRKTLTPEDSEDSLF